MHGYKMNKTQQEIKVVILPRETIPMTSMSSSRKTTTGKENQSFLDLKKRVDDIEKLLMARNEVTQTECTTPLMIDVAPFAKTLEKKSSELLNALYPPKEDGTTLYNLDELKLTLQCSGYWPDKANWHGIYLGGCDDDNNRRRAFTIPSCLIGHLPFFTPQGLQNTAEHFVLRTTALNNCSCAIVDFTWDEMCLNYSAGMDMIYLLAQGFVNLAILNLPVNPSLDSLKFVNDEKIKNVFGPYDYVSLRQRRKDYYTFLRDLVNEPVYTLVDGLREFSSFDGAKGLAHDMVNLRANYDSSNDKRVRVSVIDRTMIYNSMKIKEKDVKSDIGIMLRICFGMLLLCDMNTQSFMDATMPTWKDLLGEFTTLCTTVDVIDLQRNTTSMDDNDDKTDSDIHNNACIDLVHFVKAVVQSRPYLNF